MKKCDTKSLLISIAKRQDGKVGIHCMRDFMRFLYIKLAGSDLAGEYNIKYDLNEDSIEKAVSLNRDIFSISPKRDEIYVNSGAKSDADEVIENIVNDYFGN